MSRTSISKRSLLAPLVKINLKGLEFFLEWLYKLLNITTLNIFTVSKVSKYKELDSCWAAASIISVCVGTGGPKLRAFSPRVGQTNRQRLGQYIWVRYWLSYFLVLRIEISSYVKYFRDFDENKLRIAEIGSILFLFLGVWVWWLGFRFLPFFVIFLLRFSI